MSLFDKLSNVYFDAVQLAEALSRIPTQCDCPEELRLNGKCCCANEELRLTMNAGCVEHVNKLRNDVNWMEEDLQREKKQLRPGETEDLARQLFSIESSIGYLGSTLDRIRDQLMQPKAKCAHETLTQLKEKAARLQNCAEDLNRML